MYTIQILDYKNNVVQQWDWDDKMPIPNKGDTLLIHFGEEEYRITVLHREFDCANPSVLRIVTDYVNLLRDVEN